MLQCFRSGRRLCDASVLLEAVVLQEEQLHGGEDNPLAVSGVAGPDHHLEGGFRPREEGDHDHQGTAATADPVPAVLDSLSFLFSIFYLFLSLFFMFDLSKRNVQSWKATFKQEANLVFCLLLGEI